MKFNYMFSFMFDGMMRKLASEKCSANFGLSSFALPFSLAAIDRLSAVSYVSRIFIQTEIKTLHTLF